nr:XtrA/YqaO family protein [Fredinandcohnia onubensis]
MRKRTEEILISDEMSVTQKIEPGKVVVIVLDGHLGKAKKCEAVEHGFTVIETAKGKTARIKFEESELF